MPVCQKTGARVWMPEYQAVVVCDLYYIADCAVLRGPLTWQHRAQSHSADYECTIGSAGLRAGDDTFIVVPRTQFHTVPIYVRRWHCQGAVDGTECLVWRIAGGYGIGWHGPGSEPVVYVQPAGDPWPSIEAAEQALRSPDIGDETLVEWCAAPDVR